MKVKFLVLVFSILGISSTLAQSKGTKFSDNEKFGKYYQIASTGVYAPFPGEPHISPVQDNFMLTTASYQYAYPEKGTHTNYLYGVDVYTFKNDTLLKSDDAKVAHIARSMSYFLETMQHGKMLRNENGRFQEAPCVWQKTKISLPELGEIYINAVIFSHNKTVIRIYTFTPLEKDDNALIEAYFNSVKYQ
ncbi:MAG: hypothetical protein JST26_12230 [Bacteroidetes bacterium]|nr:hypothetical protein [Bacteroidota bacterium]